MLITQQVCQRILWSLVIPLYCRTTNFKWKTWSWAPRDIKRAGKFWRFDSFVSLHWKHCKSFCTKTIAPFLLWYCDTWFHLSYAKPAIAKAAGAWLQNESLRGAWRRISHRSPGKTLLLKNSAGAVWCSFPSFPVAQKRCSLLSLSDDRACLWFQKFSVHP